MLSNVETVNYFSLFVQGCCVTLKHIEYFRARLRAHSSTTGCLGIQFGEHGCEQAVIKGDSLVIGNVEAQKCYSESLIYIQEILSGH